MGIESAVHELIKRFQGNRRYYGRDKENVSVQVTTKNEIDGVPLEVKTAYGNGQFYVEVTEDQAKSQKDGITFVVNATINNTALLYRAFLIISNPNILRHRKYDEKLDEYYELKPANHNVMDLNFHVDRISDYITSVVFVFRHPGENGKEFYIVKDILVKVIHEFTEPEEKVKSKFTGKMWGDSIAGILAKTMPDHRYFIPSTKLHALFYGLRVIDGMSWNDVFICNSTSEILKSLKSINYAEYFSNLLWLEEIGESLNICKYNMEGVEVVIVEDKYLQMEMSNLAQKRPSLLAGDFVEFRVHVDEDIQYFKIYTGVIKTVRDFDIWIEVENGLMQKVRENPTIQLDVRFKLNRMQYERMHRSVHLCVRPYVLEMLFPTPPLLQIGARREPQRYMNENIPRNREQKLAVINILNKTSGKAPYIIFGPPGTGKTVTIVEAIYQIISAKSNSRILVTAPTNSACNTIVALLAPKFKPDQLIRICASYLDEKSIPVNVKEYCSKFRKDFLNTADFIKKFKIVVSTHMSIGRFAERGYSPTHIFIDEAAQAMEPEAICAIGGIYTSGTQVVLSGDPEQLGPFLNSRVAQNYGLGKPLLTRLMELVMYKIDGPEAHNYITKLLNNYRNQELILELPNKFFYKDELKPLVLRNEDPLCQYNLRVDNSMVNGHPIEFCNVISRQRREGKAPSFYNPSEVDWVLKYVKALLTCGVPVEQAQIGIITPYIRQVNMIRKRLQKDYPDVEVGTVEAYQGREKRIIIISTVRAQRDLLQLDEKFQIGFVKCPKRFNVAITRAMSKLIIIGNAYCLATCDYWLEYMKRCHDLQAYRGNVFLGRDYAFYQEAHRNLSQFVKK